MESVAVDRTSAAIRTGSAVEIGEVPIGRLAAGDLLVRVSLATVCGTDLAVVRERAEGSAGDDAAASDPITLGHEGVGTVEAVGPGGVSALDGSVLAPGARVVWTRTVSCGRCDRCRHDRTAECRSARRIGATPATRRWSASGAFAQYIVLPVGAHVATVPESVPDRVAAPATCATATAMAVVERAGHLGGRTVLVSGAGMRGVTAAAICRDAGAHVVVADEDPRRAALVRKFGAEVDTGEGDVDVVLEFSGGADAVQGGIDRLAPGGVCVLTSARCGDGAVIDPSAMVTGFRSIVGVHSYEPRHLLRGLDFLTYTLDRFPWTDLVADPVPLARVPEILASSPDGIRASIAP